MDGKTLITSNHYRRRKTAFTMVELLVVIAIIGVIMAMTLPALQMTREYARKATCKSHLSRLGLALQNYQGSHLVYPPGTIDRQGPISNASRGYHHNWISFLLPYLDEQLLAKRIDRNASVYAKRNAIVRNYSVRRLLCPSSDWQSLPPMSSYAGVQHPGEVPIDVNNHGVFFLNSRLRPRDINDGLAHTLFVGERLPLPSGSTAELGWFSGTRATLRNMGAKFSSGATESAPKQPLVVGGFGSSHVDRVQFLFGDGSVVSLSGSIDFDAARQLADRRDGTLVDERIYRPDMP